MTLPGPLLLGIPLAMAAILWPLRRWTTLQAWLSALTVALIGSVVALTPLHEPLTYQGFSLVLNRPLYILGRQILIEPVDRLPLAFIFFTTAGLFIIAWRLLPRSNFFSIGLISVSLLAGALMVEQVVYAALLMEMAALLAVIPLHEPILLSNGQRYGGKAQGGLRYISYITLALPGLMVTQLLLELFAVMPNDLGLLQSSTVLLGLSFAILLGAIPFQSWLITVAADGSPPVVTFLFTINLGVAWFILLAYLNAYTWLGQQALFGPFFTALGLLMIVVGGILAASQRHLGQLVGYATLVDNGAMFLALGTRQVTGLAFTMMLLLSRPLTLGVMTLGLDGLRRLGNGDDGPEAMRGLAWRAPWRAFAFLIGGVALAGFPPSLGFAARWGLYHLVAMQSGWRAVLALMGSAGVMLGVITSMHVLLSPLPASETSKRAPQDVMVIVLIVLLIGALVASSLFPQIPSHIAYHMAEGFSFFK